jgi:hypothetical protein
LRSLRALAHRDAASVHHLAAELDDEHPLLVPQLDREVSDLAGLVIVHPFMFAPPRERSALLRRTVVPSGQAPYDVVTPGRYLPTWPR